eukprot:gene24239-32671_t
MCGERNIIRQIREKGPLLSQYGGSFRFEGITVDDTLFKKVCRIINPDSRALGFRLEMINNEILITQFPSAAHEIVKGEFDAYFVLTFFRIPYKLMGSTRWNFGVSSVEANSCYRNCLRSEKYHRLDADGIQLPDIVLEVGRSQNYHDLFSRPQVYFSGVYHGVKSVVLVQIVGGNQLIAVVYRRNTDGTHGPRIAVSFGQRLHTQTANAILRHSNIAEDLFIGTGRHGVETQCVAEGMVGFQLPILDAAEIWEGVPVQQIPAVQVDAAMDLFLVRHALMIQEG